MVVQAKRNALFDVQPSYTNYDAVGLRIGRKTVTVERELNEDGEFELPSVRL